MDNKYPYRPRDIPLLFCLCVAPLSHALRKGKGFIRACTHLMLMDNPESIILYRINADATVEEVSSAIGMTKDMWKLRGW